MKKRELEILIAEANLLSLKLSEIQRRFERTEKDLIKAERRAREIAKARKVKSK